MVNTINNYNGIFVNFKTVYKLICFVAYFIHSKYQYDVTLFKNTYDFDDFTKVFELKILNT